MQNNTQKNLLSFKNLTGLIFRFNPINAEISLHGRLSKSPKRKYI